MKLFNRILSYLWPHNCILCLATTKGDIDLCYPCRADLPYHQNHNKNQHQGHTISVFTYDFPIDRMIQAFKFHQKMTYGQVLSQLFADYFTDYIDEDTANRPHIVVPVPLHKKRLKDRGFNQAEILARAFTDKAGIKLALRLAQRKKETLSQSTLQKAERRSNLVDAFSINQNELQRLIAKHPKLHIALVDDVITTGTTFSALKKAFLESGCYRVDCWSLSQAQ